MKVKVKMGSRARIPQKEHKSDFCYDVFAVSEQEVSPGVWLYGTGLSFEIVRPYSTSLNLSIEFRARSSVYKTGMILCNGLGTINEGRRGEVKAAFYHVMQDLPRYQIGDKIGQIVLSCAEPMDLEVVEELSDSDRGKGGFGSSELK